jgi:hypothetical protein
MVRGRSVVYRQKLFDFEGPRKRRERQFKRAIFCGTTVLMAGMLAAAPMARTRIGHWIEETRQAAARSLVGLEPTREEIETLRKSTRGMTIEATRRSLARFYDKTTPEMRQLFDAAHMSPANGLIAVGRPTNGFLLSSAVFEPDDAGRSYRLKPNVRSVWLRQVTLIDGPFGLFLVPDTPEVWAAAGGAGAIVDETSRQSTNSWGLRGPEPDRTAKLRGIVLGDSFMQGMFNGDEHTPPLDLKRELGALGFPSVDILNTGHIGYAPEQYYHTLLAFGDRFKPQFLVVSVCPNDFGEGDDVINGGGDDWEEARYWLEQIMLWCNARAIPCLLVPAPVDQQILGVRRDDYYPARIASIYRGSPFSVCNPFDVFLDAHLEARRAGHPAGKSALFNSQINDNHFSPAGSKLWAQIVAHRLALMLTPQVVETAQR